jgi:predicted enzyme related to lactoylglutathione lyase
MQRFFEYHLRTTDVPAARAFYATILGERRPEIFPLHEQALARGARPHWLGYIEVADVDATVAAFVARGATQLGEKWQDAQGLEAAVVRDPGGAVLALAKSTTSTEGAERADLGVTWHLLHTPDVERAKANYGELFGWHFETPTDLGELGVFHPFAWQRGGPVNGWLSDLKQRSGVHPHWLFHFRVSSLEPALETVPARGGLVLGPYVSPDGHHIAVCDDAQGAAFALVALSES